MSIASKDGFSKYGVALLLAAGLVLFCLSGTATAATPLFTGCPDRVSGSHCDSLLFQVSAMDTSNSGHRNNIRYHLITGPGTVDERTGLWLFHPDQDSALVGRHLTVEIAASIGNDTTSGSENCRFYALAYNKSPYLSTCDQEFEMEVGQTLESWYNITERDSCDVWSYVSAEIWPQPIGHFEFSMEESHSLFTPAPEDNNQVFVFSLKVTDGYDTTTCNRRFTVGDPPPFAVRIEQTEGVIQGGFTDVSIFVDEQPVGLGGFHLLVGYDASALTFQGAVAGSMQEDCGWEYFTYRYGADGNCNDACPSGLVRLVGIAETNNGNNHPGCYEAETPYTLARLSFLVSNDRNLECQFVPIRFFWIDCGDNTLTNEYGREMYIASTVKDWDYDSTGIENIGPPENFPSYLGTLESCLERNRPVTQALIDFYNGGMEIVCADSIDDRSNCWVDGWGNHTHFTVATVVTFANYFTHGLESFGYCMGADPYDSVACHERAAYCTDFNADGTGLTITDFLYLLTVVIGNPLDSVCVDLPCVSSDSGTVYWNPYERSVRIEIPEPVGAFYLEFSDSIVPALRHADEFILKYNYDGANTKCFIYSIEGAALSDEFELSYSGIGFLNTVKMATYNGVTIPAKFDYPTDVEDDRLPLPKSFTLHQNYPNPFNPTTTISFDLPEPAYVKLEIFDITGRKVATIKDNLMTAGSHALTWEARDDSGNPLASGVYLYRLTTDQIVLSKKMLLIK